MKRAGSKAAGSCHSVVCRCSTHGAIATVAPRGIIVRLATSGLIADRVNMKAGGYSRSASLTTARVTGRRASTSDASPGPNGLAAASSATRDCQSGDWASSDRDQNRVSAVVSCPARIMVATWSHSCSRLKPSPVSGSRAATSMSNRSRGPSVGGSLARASTMRPISAVHSARNRRRAPSCGEGTLGGSIRSSTEGRASWVAKRISNVRRALPCPTISSENIDRPAISSAVRCISGNRSTSVRPASRSAQATASVATWLVSTGMERGARVGAMVRRWCRQAAPSLSSKPSPNSGANTRCEIAGRR